MRQVTEIRASIFRASRHLLLLYFFHRSSAWVPFAEFSSPHRENFSTHSSCVPLSCALLGICGLFSGYSYVGMRVPQMRGDGVPSILSPPGSSLLRLPLPPNAY